MKCNLEKVTPEIQLQEPAETVLRPGRASKAGAVLEPDRWSLAFAPSLTGSDDEYPKTLAVKGSLSPILLPDHQLQARPGLVDRADLDVDQSQRKSDVADGVLGNLGRNAR